MALIGSLPVFHVAHPKAPHTFTLRPVFSVGSAFTYRTEIQSWRNDRVALHARCNARLEICARTPDGWRAQWTTRDSEILAADPDLAPLLRAMADLWDDAPIELQLHESGRLIGLIDIDAQRQLLAATLRRIADSPRCQTAQPSLTASVLDRMKPILGNSSFLSQVLTKEPRILLGAMGNHYQVGRSRSGGVAIASPFGTRDIQTYGRYTVRGIDPVSRRADLGWLMVIDREQTRQAVGAELSAIVEALKVWMPGDGSQTAAVGAEPQLAEAIANLDLYDAGDFVIDTATAWPLTVHHERRIVSGTGSRVDRVTLRRLEC